MRRSSNPIRILGTLLAVVLCLAISGIAQVSGQLPHPRPREQLRQLHLRKRCRRAHQLYRVPPRAAHHRELTRRRTP